MAIAEDPSFGIRILGGNRATRVAVEALASSGASTSRVVSLANTRELHLDLSAEETWTIRGTAQGFWSAPVDPPRGAGAAALTLWPAGEIGVDLQQPTGTALPPQLALRLSQPMSGRRSANQPPDAEIEVACPVDDEGRSQCTVPAGRWDLRLHAAGFVPHYRWNASIDIGERAELGRLVLKEGSSLLGRVTTEEGPADPRHAGVTLQPAVLTGPGAAGLPEGLQRLGLSASINEWGYFQLDGLAPGSYVLSARQPGFELSDVSIVVPSGEAVEIPEPIVLLRPLRLHVSVEPATDPLHGAWRLLLLALREGEWATIADGSAGSEGTWTSPAMPPGSYWLKVGNRAGDWVASEDLELTRDSQEVEVVLSLVHVEGRVRIGREPISAQLWFGGRTGAVSVETSSDADGEFAVVLPQSGRWVVDVSGESRQVNVTDVEILVGTPRAYRPIRVDIELPDTRISGSVVDRSRSPVAGASVQLLSVARRTGLVQSTTDDAGEFGFEGQPPGDYSVEATKLGRSSKPAELTVAEGAGSPHMVLVLEDRRTLSGRVVAPPGAVPGAQIFGYPMGTTDVLASLVVPGTRSGLDGAFRLDLPEDTAQVRLVVTALGHALKLMTVQRQNDFDEVLVSLDQIPGRVELAPLAIRDGDPESSVALVLIDGQPVDFILLTEWARAQGLPVSPGQALVVGGMPAGMYSHCAFSLADAIVVLSASAMPAAGTCSEGYLAPGGQLVLSAPPAR